MDLIKKQELEKIFGKIVESLPEVIRSPVNAKNLLLSKNKYGTGSIGYKVQSKKTETIYGFSLIEIQRVLAGYQKLSIDKKHNMFPFIASQKIACICLDQDTSKEDYYFNFKCSKTTIIEVDETINDYDVLISVHSFLDLMIGRIEFRTFEEEFILNNKLHSNLFKDQYDSGYLIKDAGLAVFNKIGFKFDTFKSPLISDFI